VPKETKPGKNVSKQLLKNYQQGRKILMKNKKHFVVLSGAGISAESGLKTFRDSDGLWNGYDVYEVASPQGWNKDPQLVLDFYNARRRDVAAAIPNAAHTGLADLEKDFNVTIVTQNIDDLHERAGSTNVLHLHGEIFKMRSVADEFSIFEIRDDIKLGDVAIDGSQLRPHIVLVWRSSTDDRAGSSLIKRLRLFCGGWHFVTGLPGRITFILCSASFTQIYNR
jgi:NAD-dependent SIR2 family protein deacetylase